MDRTEPAVDRAHRRRVSPVKVPGSIRTSTLTRMHVNSCIAYIANLVEAHHLPLSAAYPHGIAQFRTLRAEHETATRSARLEAQAFGATFFGEIERGVQVEERVLDEWVDARAIQDEFAAANAAGGAAAASASAASSSAAAQQAQALSAIGGVTWVAPPARSAATPIDDGEGTFTGGLGYVEHFAAAAAAAPSTATTTGAAAAQQRVSVGAQA